MAGGIDTPMSVPAGLRSLKERFSSGESAAIPAYADEVGGDPDTPRLLGMSPQMEEARRLIRRLAHSNVPVYIAGESAAVKEQAAAAYTNYQSAQAVPLSQ